MSYLLLSNQILVKLVEAVEGFAEVVATRDTVAEDHSAVPVDMLAKPALVGSVLCKRY